MQREIGLVILKDGYELHPNYAASELLGWRMGKRDGVIVGGCGMDMGFHLISELSATLFPDGFGCTGDKCPSNDHTNGDREYTPHIAGATVRWHKSGCYALRHRWL
jgi:hypothetical protein